MPAAMPNQRTQSAVNLRHHAGQVPMTRHTRAVAAPRVVNIEDLRRLAKRRLPAAVFDYLDGGAEGEITLRRTAAPSTL